MKLNQKSINELFAKRLLNKTIDGKGLVATMKVCGRTKNQNIYVPSFGAVRPIVSIEGAGTSVVLNNMGSTIHDEYFYSEVRHYGFKDGTDFLDWIQGCFFEVLGDKVSNLKLNKETGCWY